MRARGGRERPRAGKGWQPRWRQVSVILRDAIEIDCPATSDGLFTDAQRVASKFDKETAFPD